MCCLLTSSIAASTFCLKAIISETELMKQEHHNYTGSQKNTFQVTQLTNSTNHFTVQKRRKGDGGIGLERRPFTVKTPTVFWLCFC